MHKTFISSTVLAGLSLFATVTNASVMLGAYVQGNGWNETEIYALNEQLYKKLSFVTLFSAFTEDWDLLYWQTSKVADAGMVPMISWMPIDQGRPDVNILPEITSGQWDDYLLQWSARFSAWRDSYPESSKPTILLRFGHEFNGNWYSYGNSPDAYKAAYQYVHNLFEQQGINPFIEWVWCANNINVDQANDITRYYPGDNFVDWNSIDGYNWGTNYRWTSWDSFTDVYAAPYSVLVTNYPDKPILIAEYGSAEPTDVPDPYWGQNGDDSDSNEDKNAWSHQMLLQLQAEFPAVRGIGLFNINKELNWSVTDTGNTGLSGMNQGLTSDYFTSEYLTARSNNDSGEEDPVVEEPKRRGKNGNSGKRNKNTSEQAAYPQDSLTTSPQDQSQLSQNRSLPAIKPEKIERMRRGFLSMSPVAQARFKAIKHSAIASQ